MRDTQFWMLDTECSILDSRCWILDAGCSILDAGCWILDAGCSMLDARYWILDTICFMVHGSRQRSKIRRSPYKIRNPKSNKVTGHWSARRPTLLVTRYLSLVTGHWLLVASCWSMVHGHWPLLLVTGYWFLEPLNLKPLIFLKMHLDSVVRLKLNH
jgi:hypothetical protein